MYRHIKVNQPIKIAKLKHLKISYHELGARTDSMELLIDAIQNSTSLTSLEFPWTITNQVLPHHPTIRSVAISGDYSNAMKVVGEMIQRNSRHQS